MSFVVAHFSEFGKALKGRVPSESAFNPMLALLRFLGLWKTKEDDWTYKARTIYVFSVIALILTVGLKIVAPPWDYILGADLHNFIYAWFITYKVLHYYNSDFVQELVEELKRNSMVDYSNSSYVLHKRRQYFIHETFLMIFLFVLSYTVQILIAVEPLLLEEKTLPFTCWLPYSIENSYVFACTYAFQAFGYSLFMLIMVTYDCVGMLFLMEICFRIDMIGYKLKQIGSNGDKILIRKEIANTVEEHQHILRMKKQVNNFENIIYMGHVIIPTIGLILNTYEVTKSEKVRKTFYTYIASMMGATGQLFCFCALGESVFNKSLNLSKAAFSSNWIGLPKEQQKDLQFITHFTQQPLMFRAWPWYDLRLSSFLMLMNAAFSYITVLVTLERKKNE